MYGNHQRLKDWEGLLLICLEVGFRHLDPWQRYTNISLTHTEHHQGLVGVAFKSQKGEVIADLLHAWTSEDHFSGPADTLSGICTSLLAGLHNLVPFSTRLRRLVIRFVEIAGYKEFEGEGVEKFIELLDHLRVAVEDMGWEYNWVLLLLDVIRSSEGIQYLSHWYWELLVELKISNPRWLISRFLYRPTITKSLIEAQEWGKLECWIGIVWMFSNSRGVVGVTEEDLESSMLLLFRQRPGAAQKVEGWMERWSQERKEDVPESFRRIFERAHGAARRQVAM